MGLTLQEVLVRALKKLEDSSFQRFIEKLSVWEVREEYRNIPKDELTGKDPEHVAGLINIYYRYAYGAEVTLAVLEDIGETKVREELQQELREVDLSNHGLGTVMFTDRVNFIDNHQSDLGWVIHVDPVLYDLREQDLLTLGQYNDVIEKTTSEEKMRKLCDVIRYWEDAEKYEVYTALRKCNTEIIRDLLALSIDLKKELSLREDQVNFIDNHPPDLIREKSVLRDSWGQDLLTQKQHNDVMRKRTSEEKKRELSDNIGHLEDTGKGTDYASLRKYNKEITRDLEMEKRVGKKTYNSLRDHFLDRHGNHLIRKIKEVNPVIDDLRSHCLLTHKNYRFLQTIPTPGKKMGHLWDMFQHQSDTVKDQFYVSLWRYNYRVISNLEISDRRAKHNRRRGSSSLHTYEKKTREQSEASTISSIGVKKDDMGCELCDQLHKDSVEVIPPTIIGNAYHLSMNSPGLFRCSESGIKFRVTQPVTIEYEVDSWSKYTEILQNLHGGYEIIGPLFNIKSNVEPNVVSAVYLPHCLCLGGFKGDKSLIRCFHCKEDNLALETPSRLEAMYTVLENPTFSCIGVILYPLNLLKEEIIKLIPYHGMALLFCNTITREDLIHSCILHLYLLPRLHALEKMLLFESHCPSEIYPFTEISIQGEKNTELNVSILPEGEDVTVWETVVSKGEMFDLPSTMSQLSIQPGDPRPLPEQSDHFVDRHRAHLIRMISVVDLVLDDLLDLNLLTYEQYKTVLSQNTNAEQMRKLYDYIRAWGNGDKDQVYQSLRQHNCPIIRQLENEGSAVCNKPHAGGYTFTCNLN